MIDTLPFSLDDLLAEIGKLDAVRPDGSFTIAELCEASGIHERRCRKMVKGLMSVGKMEHVGNVRGVTMDGRPCWIPGYRRIK